MRIRKGVRKRVRKRVPCISGRQEHPAVRFGRLGSTCAVKPRPKMPSWASPHVWPRGPLTFFSRQRPTAQSLAPQTREGHRGPLAGPLAPLLASSPPRGNAYREDQSRHFSEDFAGFSKHRHSSPRALAGGLRMQSLFRSMCAWNGVERALDARVASLFAPETARGRTHARQPFLAGGALLPIGLHDGLHRHAELGVNVRTSLRIWFAHWFAPRPALSV
jgi:hypothetical protein